MDDLLADVRYNCNVSDARFWGSFSICGLLMRLRDLYRSEMNLKPWERIPQPEITRWLDDRDQMWKDLEESGYRDVRLNGISHGPFDHEGLNERLRASGLVYGAGYGLYMKPTFFLGELSSARVVRGHRIFFVDRERVRDIFSSAGMSQGRTISVRLAPLRALLWEKFSEAVSKQGSWLHEILCDKIPAGVQQMDHASESSFEEMVKRHAEFIMLHELAESIEDAPEWPGIIAALEDRATEYLLRALKDLLADTSPWGPLKAIVTAGNRESLCLFWELLSASHRKLVPELVAAIGDFREKGEWGVIEEARRHGYRRFLLWRDRVIETFSSAPTKDDALRTIKELQCPFSGHEAPPAGS